MMRCAKEGGTGGGKEEISRDEETKGSCGCTRIVKWEEGQREVV